MQPLNTGSCPRGQNSQDEGGEEHTLSLLQTQEKHISCRLPQAHVVGKTLVCVLVDDSSHRSFRWLNFSLHNVTTRQSKSKSQTAVCHSDLFTKYLSGSKFVSQTHTAGQMTSSVASGKTWLCPFRDSCHRTVTKGECQDSRGRILMSVSWYRLAESPWSGLV